MKKENFMLNFDKKIACDKAKTNVVNLYRKAKNLKKKTKEIVCISTVALMIGSFVVYDVAGGIAYASGSVESKPYVIKAGDTEVAVVQSRSDAEQTIDNIKLAYGKVNMETTAIVTPALSIEEKEYVTAEKVEAMDANTATRTILEKNAGKKPIFEVYVEQPAIRTEAIPFETVEEENADLEKGVRSIKVRGKTGVKLLTTREVLVNGKVQSSEVYTSSVKEEPTTEVVVVGTKEPEPEVTTTTSSSASSSSYGVTYSYDSATSSGILGYAQSFHGVPYVAGGSTPAGFDCSGFTSYVYRAFGVSLPRGANAQAYCGVPVSYSEAKPGDLVVMPGHVGIYAGGGMITHAPTEGKVVSTVPIWTSVSFRRLV